MNLFGAGGAKDHDPASITRGLDPTDAVLVRQILDNIAMGPVRTHRSGRGGGGGGGGCCCRVNRPPPLAALQPTYMYA